MFMYARDLSSVHDYCEKEEGDCWTWKLVFACSNLKYCIFFLSESCLLKECRD
jgi:hypothetical protein